MKHVIVAILGLSLAALGVFGSCASERDPVGQGEEDRLGLLGEQLGVWLREAERPGARKMRELSEGLRDGLARVLARGDGGEFDVRMREKQPHQFFARITGRADDGDFLLLYHFTE